jgi:DMSO reductase family type II enzyme heme b subunit
MRGFAETVGLRRGRGALPFLLFVIPLSILLTAIVLLAEALSPEPSFELAEEPEEAEEAEKPRPTADLARRGAELFAKNCAACHGDQGRGDGKAVYLLDPKARDFSTGRFRVVSTDAGVPSDEDLFAVLTRGMPGSAMPPWGHFSEEDRWALVFEVRRLAIDGLAQRIAALEDDDPVSAEEAAEIAAAKMAPGASIVPPPSPVDSLEGLFHGRRLYVANCLSCHGAAGRGDGTAEQVDESGFPTRPRDLTRGIFKGPSKPADIWKRIRAGMPGSPMPAAATLDDDSVWRLVQYVRSLVPPQVEGQVLQTRQEIVAVRARGALPLDPDSREWARSKPVYVALAPLFWRDVRPEGVLVEALHDGTAIAFRLTWEDATRNDSVVRAQDFSDAVAMQFALGPDEPLIAMGEKASPVALWYWRAAWDKDREGVPRDVEAAYPDMAVDTYPSLVRPWEQGAPMAVAESARASEFDPAFLTGRAAGNPVSTLERAHAAEAATARGFSTLSTSKAAAQSVFAGGRYGSSDWGDPSWRVVFRRSFAGLEDPSLDVSFSPGRRVPIAFAVWDGAAGDRAGQKSFSIWHDLVIETP